MLRGQRIGAALRSDPTREVYFALGNHDLVPANYFPYLNDTSFTGFKEEIGKRNQLLKDLKDIWGVPDTFLKAGYYSTTIDQDRWCLISINRYIFYRNIIL
jgi:hypothetical protein